MQRSKQLLNLHQLTVFFTVIFFVVFFTNDVVFSAGKSLYQRLGGKEAIIKVVEKFTSNQLADKRLNKYYESTDIKARRGHLVDLICEATGGP